jgi:hypothetical protein
MKSETVFVFCAMRLEYSAPVCQLVSAPYSHERLRDLAKDWLSGSPHIIALILPYQPSYYVKLFISDSGSNDLVVLTRCTKPWGLLKAALCKSYFFMAASSCEILPASGF